MWIGEEFGGVWRLEGGWLLRRGKADFQRKEEEEDGSLSGSLSGSLKSEKVAKEREKDLVLTGG